MEIRSLAPASLGLLLLAASGVAQSALSDAFPPIVQKSTHRYGTSVAVVGDSNNDGVPDVLVGDPNDDTNGSHSGSARLISGKDGFVLQVFLGEHANDDFGTSVAKAGDVDGDGVPDLVIGAPGVAFSGADSGEVYLFSGKTGQLLWSTFGSSAGERFGFSVAGAGGDVNGDGVPDVIAGAPHYSPGANTNLGRSRVISGATGFAIYVWTGVAAGDQWGYSVGGLGDIDADGRADLIVGSPFENSNGGNSGTVRVISGMTGLILYEHHGSSAGAHLGISVAGAGDVDNDGRPDFIHGAPFAQMNGRAVVHSGKNDSVILDLPCPPSYALPADDTQFGACVRSAGDVNGDGSADVIVGAPGLDLNGIGADMGAAFVFHANGNLVYISMGFLPGDGRGASVAGGGDFDQNGKADVVVGAPTEHSTPGVFSGGSAYVQSGVSGLILLWLKEDNAGTQLGASVALVGDVDADGRGDFAVGAPFDDLGGGDTGSVSIYSGASGSVLRTLVGPMLQGRFGAAVCGVGDLDGDGHAEVLVGAPYDDTAFNNAGAAYVSDGMTGALSFALTGSSSGNHFGAAVCACGDFDQDGVPDFAVGSPNANPTAVDAGKVNVCSGATFTVIRTLNGPIAGAHFGTAIADAGDADGDGVDDLVVGAPDDSTSGASGSVWLYSGKTGALLQTHSASPANAGLGAAVCGLGDVNLDGRSDFAVGAPHATPHGADSGRVFLYSGKTGTSIGSLDGQSGEALGSAVAGAGDFNLDGTPDLAIGTPGATSTGRVQMRNGASLALEYLILPSAGDAQGFGSALSGGPDTNGDGYPDLAIGAPLTSRVGLGAESGAAFLESLVPKGLSFYGNGTPGCAGAERLTGNLVPFVGNAGFTLDTNHAPASALGLGLLANAQDAAGSDPFGLGIKLHVDLLHATQIVSVNFLSDANGIGIAPVPIPNNPAAVGVAFYAQSIWSFGAACPLPPFGLSSSKGLKIVLQP